MKNTFLFLVSVLCAPLVLTAPAYAAATPWVSVLGGEVRMISSDAPLLSGEYQLGLEFKMEPGWHIYWRFPGESGVPTEADFSASTNLASATLRYPAPERYNDGYSTAIIYRDHVVLPVAIKAADPSAPLDIAADVRFGICSDICVPAQALLKLPLSPDSPANEAVAKTLASAWRSVPKPQDDGLLRVAAIDRLPSGAKGKRDILTITVELADSAAPFDLFAEGAPGSYIEVPRLIATEGAKATFELSTEGLKEDGDEASLALVLTNGDEAVELITLVKSVAGN